MQHVLSVMYSGHDIGKSRVHAAAQVSTNIGVCSIASKSKLSGCCEYHLLTALPFVNCGVNKETLHLSILVGQLSAYFENTFIVRSLSYEPCH